MHEGYYVLKFSSGTYFDGTRYSSNTLEKAEKFDSRDKTEKTAIKVKEDRCVEVTVVPVIIKEVLADDDLLEAVRQALSCLS